MDDQEKVEVPIEPCIHPQLRAIYLYYVLPNGTKMYERVVGWICIVCGDTVGDQVEAV